MEKTLSTIIFLAFSIISFGQVVPIDFETTGNGANWTWTVFEDNTNPPVEIITNPFPGGINASPTVAKFTALQAGAPWAGCETMHGSDIGTFNITASNHIITVMVYKTKVSNVGIKLVTSTSAALPEILVPNTLINQWELLTFDFSAHIGGMTYDQLVFFPDFIARPADDIIYFDNIWGGNGSGLGINSNKLDNYLQVYPNPNNGIFTIETGSNEIDKIELYNLSGKLVRSIDVNQETMLLDLSELNKGIYFLKAESKGEFWNHKIVIE